MSITQLFVILSVVEGSVW